jgi:predicted TIM-barrel fold metal-dependent hydrolase
MTRTYQAISADGHLECPPDDYTPYIPAEHRDLAPRRIATPGMATGDSWLIEGQPLWHTGTNLTAGEPLMRKGKSYWNPDGTRATGAGDGAQRLREQDRDGIDAEILFPPIFAVDALAGVSYADAYLGIVQGYNSYLAEEYCAVAPDRLIANGVIPARGVDMAIKELERCAKIGLKTVALSSFPNGTAHPKPEDDRFWDAALTLGMPISAHTHFGMPYPPSVSSGSAHDIMRAQGAAPEGSGTLCTRQGFQRPSFTVSQLIFAGVFERFPDLKLYFAEVNASWLPLGLQQMDENYLLYAHTLSKKLDKMPSEYFKQHIFVSFIQDRAVTKMFDLVPVDNLMWGTDFPHSVTSFPNSQAWLDEAFAGENARLRRKILVDTPAAYFHLDVNAELTPTPQPAMV